MMLLDIIKMKKAFSMSILIIFFISEQTFAFDMKTYINQHKNQNLEVFLKKFSYDEYLKTISFVNFSKIQEDRFLIWRDIRKVDGKQDGDEFLYYLADYFLKTYPVISNQIDEKISIGEAYLNPQKILKNPSQPNLENNPTQKANTNEVYEIIGYYILSKVATKIEKDIKNKKIKGNDPTIQLYVNRLKNNKVIVSIEESSTQKIITNIKHGKLDYLWDRAKIAARPILCKLGFWILGIIVILIVGIFLKFVPKIIRIIIFFPFAVLLIVFKFTIFCNGSTSISTTSPNFKQISFKNIHRLNNNEHLVNIYQLKNGYGNLIGYSIWLKRPQIKTAYYAFEPSKNLRKYQNIVLATTGGYTTNNVSGAKPDGFTVQNGELSNAILLHDRQGLVLFAKDGIRVLDLKAKNITLPNGDVLESPYNSILSYSKLLNWCKINRATIFQSHLLAYSDSILINPSKAPSSQRERRLLALFSDKQGNVIHAIFDIKEPYDLAIITKEIFNIIASRKLKVEGIVNLDTGSYNILNVFDEKGNIIREVMAPVDISDATNLIIYYK